MKLKNKLTTTKKIILLSTTLSIVIAAISFFVLYPYFTKIQTLNTEINDKRIQLAIYEEQRKNIDKTRFDLKKIENDIDNISHVFIKQDNIIDLIDSLDLISESNNLTQKIDITNIEDIEINQFLLINVTIDGQWDSIISYLNTLEKLDYYIVLDNLNFINQNNFINFTFTAIIYSS